MVKFSFAQLTKSLEYSTHSTISRSIPDTSVYTVCQFNGFISVKINFISWKKDKSQPLKIQLQSWGSLTWVPDPTSLLLAVFASGQERFPRAGGSALCPGLSRAQTLCPHQPSHSFQSMCPFALLPDIQPGSLENQLSFSVTAPPVTNVWSTTWLLRPAGFSGVWIKVKIENKEGEEKWQAETCKEKEDKVQKIGFGMPGRGWGLMGWCCHLVAARYSGKKSPSGAMYLLLKC